MAGEPAARCYRVLVVDEDPRSRRVVVAALAREGMEAVEAATEDAARIALASTPPDVVVLDVSVGGLDGFTLLSEIRHDSDVPVVVLTDRAEEPFKLLGLELGADDYMAKPFSPLELTSRIRVILRRAHSHDGAGSIRAGELTIDLDARAVTISGRPVELTSREFDVLAHLARHPNTVHSRATLLREVWHSSAEWQHPSTVTEHVRRIRTKIEADAAHPRWIHTVRGVGYRFEL